jgi:hypothetical protein
MAPPRTVREAPSPRAARARSAAPGGIRDGAGFESFEDYVVERLDPSLRTARRRWPVRSARVARLHHRGEHAKGLKVRGRAPDGLVFELPIGCFLSGDRYA